MPPGNITRSEAAQRRRDVTVISYHVELDLRRAPVELGEGVFTSATRIEFQAEPGTATWVDLFAESVESVQLNGVPLAGELDDGRLVLPGLAAANVLEVVARCAYSTTGEGLHRFCDPVDDRTYLYSQFATAEARRVFACFEQPDMKAPLRLTVLAPAGWEVVSNSPASNVADQAGHLRWEFKPTPPLPTYVIAVIAGPYHRVNAQHQGIAGPIPLGLFVRASMAEYLDTEELFAITRAGLDHCERIFAMAYPFAKYDQVFVPQFNLGAMENPGAVTFREDAFIYRGRVPASAHELRANVILHEMAHMWFGDLVTMRWWDDLWLNESFAEWCGHHVAAAATPYVDSWVTFALSGKARAARADQLPSTHPVAADMVDLNAVYLNFDGITYAKGASVLRQLVAWVGLEAFLRGVSEYFVAHAWGNTTFADLMGALSQASGRDLGDWAAKWLQSVGVNTIRLRVATEGGRYGRVELIQEPAVAPPGVTPVLRPHRVVVGGYRWQENQGVRRLVRAERHELDLVGPTAQVTGLAGATVAPLLLPNDDDLTFAKIRLDPQSQEIAFAHVSQVADPLARALIWGCAWDMVRDAQLPGQDYLEMVARSLGPESNTSVLAAVHATLVDTIGRFLPPGRMGPEQVQLAAAALAHARECPPGSDAQLLHARAFVRHARSPQQLDVLARMLEHGGGEIAEGLQVDQELRWEAVTRLVARGARPAEIVRDELQRDPTMPGQRAAAYALAAQPDPAAKEAAWRSCLTAAGWRGDWALGDPVGEPMSNAALRATVAGFGYPEQADLVASYAPKYFQVVSRVWGSGSPNNTSEVARGLFPSGQVSAENLAAAREFLAQPGLDPGLARIVAEGADGLDRALRARACSDHHSR